jgi:hypothetical protein
LGRGACPRCFVDADGPALQKLIPVFAALLLVIFFAQSANPQQAPGRQISFPIAIQWNKQKAVSTYRLQIAGDESFRDIFLDRRINGARYVVSNLPPGYYYWRVAPADFGAINFSRPARFFVSGGVIRAVKLPVRTTNSRLLSANSQTGSKGFENVGC